MSANTRITITVEPITATFLHVEPEGPARWRAAPWRGLVRWWFRALAGAALDRQAVWERERALFGSADAPSPVAFRVFPLDGGAAEQRVRMNPSGTSQERRYTATRSAIVPAARSGTRVVLAPSGSPSSEASCLEQAYAAFWVACHFGGVGQRSRRGAGSVRMSAVEGIDAPAPIRAGAPADLAAGLARGLAQARRRLGLETLRSLAGPEPEFPILHPACATAWVVEGRGAPSELAVRERLMDVRRGLPGHRSRGLEPEFGFAERRARLASPVWVRVAHVDEQRTLFVITLLRHTAARGARWGSVEEFVRALGTPTPVKLGGAGA
jgi:CRISPR type III-B/RAMP module RAMP protein Cmr1